MFVCKSMYIDVCMYVCMYVRTSVCMICIAMGELPPAMGFHPQRQTNRAPTGTRVTASKGRGGGGAEEADGQCGRMIVRTWKRVYCCFKRELHTEVRGRKTIILRHDTSNIRISASVLQFNIHSSFTLSLRALLSSLAFSCAVVIREQQQWSVNSNILCHRHTSHILSPIQYRSSFRGRK